MTATAKDRVKRGKGRRDAVSRAAQAQLNPKDRRFDAISVLRASVEGRVPQLLPMKYGRMQLSPFAFFRGAVSIMAADLGRLANSGLHAQLCGDAHVQNLGSFATPEGKLVFDLNDFDETIRGPWEWDVKRMATSLMLAGAESGHDRVGCRDAAEFFAATYCQAIREFTRRCGSPNARDLWICCRSSPRRIARANFDFAICGRPSGEFTVRRRRRCWGR
jgi:hypothetical protein